MSKFLGVVLVSFLVLQLEACQSPCSLGSTTGLGIVKGLSWVGAGALTHYALQDQSDTAASTAALGATVCLIAVNKGIDVLQKGSCIPCVDKAVEIGCAVCDIAGMAIGFFGGSLGLHYLREDY